MSVHWLLHTHCSIFAIFRLRGKLQVTSHHRNPHRLTRWAPLSRSFLWGSNRGPSACKTDMWAGGGMCTHAPEDTEPLIQGSKPPSNATSRRPCYLSLSQLPLPLLLPLPISLNTPLSSLYQPTVLYLIRCCWFVVAMAHCRLLLVWSVASLTHYYDLWLTLKC